VKSYVQSSKRLAEIALLLFQDDLDCEFLMAKRSKCRETRKAGNREEGLGHTQ
jgi:hypothetical protein